MTEVVRRVTRGVGERGRWIAPDIVSRHALTGNDIQKSFQWNQSPQGYDYWSDIHHRYRSQRVPAKIAEEARQTAVLMMLLD